VRFGRIHSSQLREGANAGQHTPTFSLPPSHHCLNVLLCYVRTCAKQTNVMEKLPRRYQGTYTWTHMRTDGRTCMRPTHGGGHALCRSCREVPSVTRCCYSPSCTTVTALFPKRVDSRQSSSDHGEGLFPPGFARLSVPVIQVASLVNMLLPGSVGIHDVAVTLHAPWGAVRPASIMSQHSWCYWKDSPASNRQLRILITTVPCATE
jgi:hypothetical protein